MKNVYLAADFGAGSGRIIAGWLENGKLMMKEIHRFPNRQIKLGNHLYWDFLSLFEELKTGMKIAAQHGFPIKSIGIDTWGVDFGLIDARGNLLANPVCYRDERTNGMPDKVFRRLDKAAHYADTGIQVMAINTLFQLVSLRENNDSTLHAADKLLFMPDLFSYFLTGAANNEYCIASTSELLNAAEKTWSEELIQALDLPRHLFGDIVMPGEKRGKLKKEIAQETGLSESVEVIAVASHDTASAVLAVPSPKKQKVFLSSGTWSILGAAVKEPILTEKARTSGFTNEGGVEEIRFLQNITGLWILQQLMKDWKEKESSLTYDKILLEAENARCDTIIDVDDARFLNPDDMAAAIEEYCHTYQQSAPETRGEFTKCVLQSLAERYKKGIDELQLFLNEPITELHIIGGGSQNKLLNRLTAERLNMSVLAGPVEATAMGNLLMQALSFGELKSRNDIQDIVYSSAGVELFKPK